MARAGAVHGRGRQARPDAQGDGRSARHFLQRRGPGFVNNVAFLPNTRPDRGFGVADQTDKGEIRIGRFAAAPMGGRNRWNASVLGDGGGDGNPTRVTRRDARGPDQRLRRPAPFAAPRYSSLFPAFVCTWSISCLHSRYASAPLSHCLRPAQRRPLHARIPIMGPGPAGSMPSIGSIIATPSSARGSRAITTAFASPDTAAGPRVPASPPIRGACLAASRRRSGRSGSSPPAAPARSLRGPAIRPSIDTAGRSTSTHLPARRRRSSNGSPPTIRAAP